MHNADIIRDVWEHNLEEEMENIRELVTHYPFVAMDTEFPGMVSRPIGPFKSASDYNYQMMKINVNLLKIIQLGITFSDNNGNFPRGVSTWQFHFKFDLDEDVFADDSIDLLRRAGINFEKTKTNGIDIQKFGEVLTTSGIVLNDKVKWISFHSGCDFGYLVKLLTGLNLPETEQEFHELLSIYFPCVYDIKQLMKCCRGLKGGLNELADDLQVNRIGPQHQAGSDSLLTLQTFFKMKNYYFDGQMEDGKFEGKLYGLGPNLNPTFSQLTHVYHA